MPTQKLKIPDGSAQTNETANSCVPCKAPKIVKVTYILKHAVRDVAGLPILPNIVSGEKTGPIGKIFHLSKSETFSFFASSGDRVGIYLGSDAKADYRTTCLYQIDVKDNDIEIEIQEKKGKHAELTDTPVLLKSEKNKNFYRAYLTGDIWAKFSHIYSATEAESAINAEVPTWVKEGVINIYKGNVVGNGHSHSIELIKANGAKLKVHLDGGANPMENISSIDYKTGVYNRVNPETYVAALTAAAAMDLDMIKFSSGWRPMLGSVLHRLGIGLDVTMIKHGDIESHLARNINVDEKNKRDAWLKAKSDLSKLPKNATTEAKKAAQDATDKAWNDYEAEITKNQTSDAAKFRQALLSTGLVRQVFDAWYMEPNSTDKIPPQPNLGQSGNEKLHLTHLHITAFDNELGYPNPNKKKAINPNEDKMEKKNSEISKTLPGPIKAEQKINSASDNNASGTTENESDITSI